MATYYVDHVGGDDTDTGLVDHAWQHCPGTVGVTGTGWVALAADDVVLFKGGVTWAHSILVDSTNFGNGSSGHYITLKSGELASYGTGRAVIDGESTDGTDGGTAGKGFYVRSRDYIEIYGIEIKRMKNVTDSAGIFVDGTCIGHWFHEDLIHDIYGAQNSSGYGIELTGTTLASYNVVEKNTIYHCEEKAIEIYRQGYCTVRFNTCYQTQDHVLVVSSSYNDVYKNIIYQSGYDWMGGTIFQPASGIKIAGWQADDGAVGNRIYNNLIWNCTTGIGLYGCQDTEVYENTVFYTGFYGTNDGGEDGAALTFCSQSPGGECTGALIKNNIFFAIDCFDGNGSGSAVNFDTALTGDNNTVTNNICYNTAATTGYLFVKTATKAFSATGDVAWFEGVNGFSSVGSGNTASGNIESDPTLVGGNIAETLAACPTGFDVSWEPNNAALSIPTGSPAKDAGAVLASPYNVDILDAARPQGAGWDIGAYEYDAGGGTTYNVIYDGNGNVTGTPPIDSGEYAESASVTVLGNTGALKRTYYAFKCWNTQADGGGTDYYPGATLSMPGESLTLFAIWVTAYVVM